MSPLPGSRESVGGCVRETDHGGGPHLQGAPEGTGSLKGVRGGYVDGIYGESHNESSWEGGRGATKLENSGHRGRATDICLRSCPVEGCLRCHFQPIN